MRRAVGAFVVGVLVCGSAFGQGPGGVPGADVTVISCIPFPPGGGENQGGGRGGAGAGVSSVSISFYCRAISDPGNVAGGGQSAAALTYMFLGEQTQGGGTPAGEVVEIKQFGGGLTRQQVWDEIDSCYAGVGSMKWNWAFDNSGNSDMSGRNTQPLWNAFKTAFTTGETSLLCDWATITTHNEDCSNAAYWEQDPAGYTPCAQCLASGASGGGGGTGGGGGGGGGGPGSLCGGPNQPPCPPTCDVPGKPCCDRDRDGCCDVDDPQPDDEKVDCGGCGANWKATWDNIIGTVRSWGVDLSGLTCPDCTDIRWQVPLYFPDGAGGWAPRNIPVGIMPDSSFVAYDAVEGLRQMCRGISTLAFLVFFCKHLWTAVRTTI